MREIDWDNPSDEDREWVERYGTSAMSRRLERVAAARASVQSAASEEEDEDETPDDEYDSMNLDQLKAVAKARKQEHPDFDTTGVKNKGELVERLREWDAEHPSEEG